MADKTGIIRAANHGHSIGLMYEAIVRRFDSLGHMLNRNYTIHSSRKSVDLPAPLDLIDEGGGIRHEDVTEIVSVDGGGLERVVSLADNLPMPISLDMDKGVAIEGTEEENSSSYNWRRLGTIASIAALTFISITGVIGNRLKKAYQLQITPAFDNAGKITGKSDSEITIWWNNIFQRNEYRQRDIIRIRYLFDGNPPVEQVDITLNGNILFTYRKPKTPTDFPKTYDNRVHLRKDRGVYYLVCGPHGSTDPTATGSGNGVLREIELRISDLPIGANHLEMNCSYEGGGNKRTGRVIKINDVPLNPQQENRRAKELRLYGIYEERRRGK